MCGIAGFLGDGDQSDLRRMTQALAHRGPDGESFYENPGLRAHLGHRRLSVVDLESGAQPMSTPNEDLWIIFNGEIYNHALLRSELESAGHSFRSDHSDTEVLLHGYREWGTKLVDHLNGMWSFAILDSGRKRLFLSRDRFGQKPLFWTHRPGCFAFASELTALCTHRRGEASLSVPSVQKLFAYGWIPSPHSLYTGISKLPAGHNLIVNTESLEPKIESYWKFELDAPASLSEREQENHIESLRETLFQAVNRRLVADVPVGVFLSGGLDSSIVTALASQTKPDQTLRTYSIGFDEKSFDESGYAARVASHFGTQHTSAIFSLDRARQMLPEVIDGLDEPFGDASLLPTALLCREARKEVTVALGGDGADELFAGYDPFRALRLAEIYQSIVPQPVHQGLRMIAARLPVSAQNMSFDFRLNRTLKGLDHPPMLWNPAWLGPLEPTEIAELLSEPVQTEDLYSDAISVWDDCGSSSLIDQTLQFYTRMYLQDNILTKADRASMMYGLELRSPFLDQDVVDLVRRIPNSLKFQHGRTKALLRKAASPWLPAEVIDRPKKGFGMPTSKWLRSGGLSFPACPALSDAGVNISESITSNLFLEKRLREHRAGQKDHRLYLFTQWALDRHQGRSLLTQ